MADKDRSNFLLSAEALPKVKIPKASEHKPRQFRLPSALGGASAGASEPAHPSASSADPQAAAVVDSHSDSIAEVAPPAETGALDSAASSEPGPSNEGASKRSDSTLRFKDRTLGWFRAGEDLAEEEESEEYEAAEQRSSRTLLLAVAIVVLLAALAVGIWRIS